MPSPDTPDCMPRFLPALLVLIGLIAGGLTGPGGGQAQSGDFSVLVFSKTEGFRHSSIPDGKQAIEELGVEHGFSVQTTEDASAFTASNLEEYDAVVFLNTTGNVLNGDQESAFEGYVQNGGGYVGVHSAADTEYDWDWYGNLVGAYFQSHPHIQTATVKVADRVHPSTEHLPARWVREDEWYDYRENPRGDVHVLATVEESTYQDGRMGHDHPIAWAHRYDGGRAWYTGLGHTKASYEESAFRTHLLGGIRWAAGVEEGDVSATVEGRLTKEILVEGAKLPIEMEVAPDGRVFFLERKGRVRVWNPASGTTTEIDSIPVSTSHEDGMLGLALDPDFSSNGWLYIAYSTTEDTANVLDRYTLAGGALTEQQQILKVPTQREQCCHQGGGLEFGPGGNLFMSTGDDTNPFASDGFAPLDEREDRTYWDAQRTAANTMDLRGKILRITPQNDGIYTIPDGNLFPNGEDGRPEIYVMGNRNPYRISVDPETGWLYWGEVGPDSDTTRADRGPAGHDELNQAREAGNYGWPYFVADNRAYHEYDFETEQAGAAFDPESPTNNSVNNTGATDLPPAQPALVWYRYGKTEAFPQMGSGGRTAMAGPVYHHDSTSVAASGLPSYYDGTLFFYEWARGIFKEIKLDASGEILTINPFASTLTFKRPIDVEIGPEGRMYVAEWGNDFWGDEEAQIVRLLYDAEGETTTDNPVAEKPEELPTSYALTNYPNPFNPSTLIRYELPEEVRVRLRIYDARGRLVRELVDAAQTAGSYEVAFSAENLPSGLYVTRLQAGNRVLTRKMTLVR